MRKWDSSNEVDRESWSLGDGHVGLWALEIRTQITH